ncbi:MAG: hypothetical protein Q8M15_14290 [Bacteroidota bacterium]|nr:hypothetical protein [Bacteroidota bacterium]
MIIACPKCDSLVPINQDIATHMAQPLIACPSCEYVFNPSVPEENPIDLRINEITRRMLKDSGLQKSSERICEDC